MSVEHVATQGNVEALRRRPSLTLDTAPDVLTVEQTAAVLRIGRNQAYDAIRRGQLFAVRIGRSWRVPKAALVRFLEDSEAAETS